MVIAFERVPVGVHDHASLAGVAFQAVEVGDPDVALLVDGGALEVVRVAVLESGAGRQGLSGRRVLRHGVAAVAGHPHGALVIDGDAPGPCLHAAAADGAVQDRGAHRVLHGDVGAGVSRSGQPVVGGPDVAPGVDGHAAGGVDVGGRVVQGQDPGLRCRVERGRPRRNRRRLPHQPGHRGDHGGNRFDLALGDRLCGSADAGSVKWFLWPVPDFPASTTPCPMSASAREPPAGGARHPRRGPPQSRRQPTGPVPRPTSQLAPGPSLGRPRLPEATRQPPTVTVG